MFYLINFIDFCLLHFLILTLMAATCFKQVGQGQHKTEKVLECSKKPCWEQAGIRLPNINGHGMSEHSSVLCEDARSFLLCYAYTCSQRSWSQAPSFHSPPYVMQVPMNSLLWLSVGHLVCLQYFVVCGVICRTPLHHISYVSRVFHQACCATKKTANLCLLFCVDEHILCTRSANPNSHSFMGTEIHFFFPFWYLFILVTTHFLNFSDKKKI